jgi:hypothetical protein
MAYQVTQYSARLADDWNQFVKHSRNSTFLFDRDFMDYHADRFQDHSVIVSEDNGNIVACFPANEKDGIIYAHQGLSYGGLVQGIDDKLETTLLLWYSILEYYAMHNIEEVVYKHFPSLYNAQHIHDTEYAMFLLNAELVRRDTTFVIDFDQRIKIAKNYKRQSIKAEKAGYQCQFTDDYEGFWDKILVPNLKEKFGLTPVHSLEEILLLKHKFKNEINLYGVYGPNKELIGGTVLFDCGHVRHCQYIASVEEARASGAHNLLFADLINHSDGEFRLFDFGIANEKEGRRLNYGLANWKQRMGGRAMTHDFYKISTAQANLLSIV